MKAPTMSGKVGQSSWIDVQATTGVDKTASELRVLAFLNESVDVVRVTTEEGANFGHQHAAMSSIRELRALGYTGKIELIVPDGAEDKMAQLLPGFDPALVKQDIEHGLDIHCIKAKAFDGAHATRAVGLVAATDKDEVSFPEALGVDTALVLQPYEWPGERRIERQGQPTETLDLPGSSTFVYTPDNPLDGVDTNPIAQSQAVSKFIRTAFEAAGADPEIKAKASGLEAILRGVLTGRIDLMPVYGLHSHGLMEKREIVLENLQNGAAEFQKRQGNDAKPAVILEIGPTETGELANPALSAKLRMAKKDEVMTISAGTLPRPIFELLYQMGTLPSVFEGANTSNLAQLIGRPFLSAFPEVTLLPDVPGVEGVEKISEGLRKDQAGRQTERVGELLMVLAQMSAEVPRSALTPVYEAIRNGEPLSDPATRQVVGMMAQSLAASGRGSAEAQAFVQKTLEPLRSLTRVLANLPTLPDEMRQQVAEFDMSQPDAFSKGEAIMTSIRKAFSAIVADRFAQFIEAARTPGSKVSEYYARAQDAATAPECRQLIRGLDRVREMTEG